MARGGGTFLPGHIRNHPNPGQATKPWTVHAKEGVSNLINCISVFYTHHMHPQRPIPNNKAIITLPHRPPFAPAPSSVPFERAMFAINEADFVQNDTGPPQMTGFRRPRRSVQPPPSSTLRRSRGAQAAADNVRSLPPSNHLRLMLPCLAAGPGRRGHTGHRSTFSACRCARWDGASTGVDPQKERGASAVNWFWEVMIIAARPPRHRNGAAEGGRGHAIFLRRSK